VIGVIDYGAGNLRSVGNALERIGLAYVGCAEPEQLAAVERIVLPGVGHFGAAARNLESCGMRAAIRDAAAAGRPLLGICLGMQLLLDGSDEAPGGRGLGLIEGRSVRLEARRVPHMGWNRTRWGDGAESFYYYAHSYVVATDARFVVATCELEGRSLPAVVRHGSILGVQFHPERSGEDGLALLEEFARC
jgi:glutamine amidotransferase